MKEKPLTYSVKVSPEVQTAALAITAICRMPSFYHPNVLRTVAAYFGYRSEKL